MDKVKVLIRMHAKDNRYSIWDAICLWFELDPDGEEANYLRLVNDPYTKILTDYRLLIDWEAHDEYISNPFLCLWNSVFLKWASEDVDIIDDNKKAIERFRVFHKEWNGILSMLNRKGCGGETISRDDLLHIAWAMEQRPRFLFPEDDSSEASASMINENYPKLLRIAIEAWNTYWCSEKITKKEVIVGDLQQKYDLSKKEAEAVDQIIRPDLMKVGGHLRCGDRTPKTE